MEHRSEHEQIEAIKEWWDKNGKFVVTVVVAVLAVVAGTRFWFGYQEQQREAASVAYQQLLEQTRQEQSEAALRTGSQIIEEFPNTAYAPMAALAMARLEVEAGKPEAAETRLRWALEHADDEALQHVARLRLARLVLSEGRLDEALDLAKVDQPGAFAGEYAAVRGDVFAAQGKTKLAEQAYNTALNDPSLAPEQRNLIQMKLDNLSVEREAS